MNKEVIIVILDAHCSMGKQFNGNNKDQTRFALAIESVKMLLQQKLLYASPNHEFGMVLFGTSETANNLADKFPNEFQNVSCCQTISKIDQELYRRLDMYVPEQDPNSPHADFIDGIAVALQMLDLHCGQRKYKKRVFLITDGESKSNTNPRELASMVNSLNENGVRLNVITLDFANELAEDDEEEAQPRAASVTETKQQTANKKLLIDICKQINVGAIYPASMAIQIYQQFNKKEYSARTKFKGNLDISQDLNIGVSIYSRTREETFPSLKKYSKVVDEQPGHDAGKVILDRQYTEVDDTEQKSIPQDQQRKAYWYGKQLVPVSTENEGVLKGKSASLDDVKYDEIGIGQNGDIERQFKMLGFCKESEVPRHHFMQGVDVILPIRGAKNERAFAAMVTMMIETKKVMLAKIMERKNADPKLVSLYPYNQKKRPLLYMVQLPTSEDLREYQFPQLVSSTNKQRQAASDFIDALDLCQGGEEKLNPKMTFNPALQYFAQVVTHKIAHPDEAGELPELNENIANQIRPDRELFENAEQEILAFEDAFDLKEVVQEPEKKRVFWKDIIAAEEQKQQKMAEEFEAERLKNGKPNPDDIVKEIGSVNPVADFNRMINDRNVDRVGDAIGQMQKMIKRQVDASIGGDLFDKAIECLLSLREGCVREDEAESFNKFLELLAKNEDFFDVIKQHRCSLITKEESAMSSTVTQKQANDFLQDGVEKKLKTVTDAMLDELD